jgi:hypothetical protein
MVKDVSQSTNRFSPLYGSMLGFETNTPVQTFTKDEPESTSYELSAPQKVYIRTIKLQNAVEMSLELQTIDTGARITIPSLLDSGATGMFIDASFVKGNGLTTHRLPRAVPVYNIDGTLNEGGSITEEVDLIMRFKEHTERVTFAVTNLGRMTVVVGHSWLQKHNPEINWVTGEVKMTRCPSSCGFNKTKPVVKSSRKRRQRARRARPGILLDQTEQDAGLDDDFDLEQGDRVFAMFEFPDEEHISATSNISQRLAEEAHRQDRPKTFEEIVPPRYWQYKDVFSKASFDELPARKKWDHAIELKPGSEPRSTKIYPLSPDEQKQLDEFLEENLKTGRIRPSKSPMASPVFFIKKKDGSLRLVQDYRKLNDMTIKNAYPLPLISELVNQLRRAKYFTKLDVRWGYNNVRIREGDEWKAAFRTNRGLFEPLVMFFGLTNSPATFQTMMNELFQELINEGCVVVYIDDILIFTETLEEHRRVVERVLEILQRNNLYLKAEKCEFEKLLIEYLGLIISQGHIEMDPVKVEGVARWPVPTRVKDVQSFLGFVNFYRRFIKDFSNVARPLHDLTRKDTPWHWGEQEQEAFDKLKSLVTSAPILTFPKDDKPFRIEADSSDFATGAVISQEGDDQKLHPIAFLSRSLSDVERNYEIYDKEMLAIIRALEEWRYLLEGAKHPFSIHSDHRNLQYFREAQKLNRRQARWSLFLSRFDFQLVHRPGRQMGKPDALSRRPDHNTGQDDNADVILLKPELFQIAAARRGHLVASQEEHILLKEIRQSKEWDEQVVKAVEEMRKAGPRSLHGAEWSEEDGLILFRGKVYVPANPELRRKIVGAHHDTRSSGHPGRFKTHELVSRNYWWPGMTRYITAYVTGCDRCNRTKTFPSKPVGTLKPNRVPDRRWQVITVDLITGLPDSQGYNSIFVVVDRLSKRIHIAPTTDEVNSEGVARLFRDHVWRHHGLPEEVISDRGSTFVSKFMRELYRLLGIKIAASTAYHPQTDGQTERVNQEIEQYLRTFVNHRQDDWMD